MFYRRCWIGYPKTKFEGLRAVVYSVRRARVAELADALDSKSSDRKIVWVRAPPPAVFSLDVCTFTE